jgi:hypothetical protein
MAQQVMAHEIGHLVDWFPDKVIKRGNILGRVATLRKHLKHVLEGTEFNRKTMMNELKALTQVWKPFDPAKNPKFTKYRHSAVELYADAISVLINEPQLLKEMAPSFNKAFFNYIERKPEVKKAYEGIQERLSMGPEEVLRTLQKQLEEMFERGERRLKEAERPKLSDLSINLKSEIIDKNSALIRRNKELKKRGIKIDPANDPVYWVEELPYVSGEAFAYYRGVNNNVMGRLETAGISRKYLRDYMFYKRVATERSDIANPLGHTKETAIKQLDRMEHLLGKDKFRELENSRKAFWEQRQKFVIPTILESKLFTKELEGKIANNEFYATFDLQAYIEGKYGKGTGAMIHKQIGTLAEITDPMASTMMKDAALIRFARDKQAKQKTVEFHNKYFPEHIKEADKFRIGKHVIPKEPKDPTMGMISYLNEGKMESYYVDKYIADTFKRDPFEAGAIMRGIETMTAPLKSIFVGKNPFWAIWNVQRDIKAFAKQMPEGSIPKSLYWGVRALPEAWRDVVKGESSKLVEDMYVKKELIPDYIWRSKEELPDAKIDRLIQSISRDEQKYNSLITAPIIKLWNSLEVPGRVAERVGKIAGRKYLETKNMSPKEISHLVRTAAGSPDFLRGGMHRRFYNAMFLFSNAGKEGIRSAYEAAQRNPAAYAWKTFKYDIAPKLTMMAATAGMFGKGYKEMMDDIPDHDKQNYITIPLFKNKRGKTVYFIMPHDFQGQVVGGLLWRSLKTKSAKDVGSMLDFMAGGIPYTSVNPWIGTSLDVGQYVTGKNPYNEFYGTYVVPDLNYEAGGWKSHQYMLRHMWNSMGGSMVYRFDYDGLEEVRDGWEKLFDVPVTQAGLRRLVRVSDKGLKEELQKAKLDVRRKRAGEIIEAKDVLKKITNAANKGEQPNLNTSDIMKLFKMDPRDRNIQMIKNLTKSHGMIFVNEYLTARSNNEKMAVIKRYSELRDK